MMKTPLELSIPERIACLRPLLDLAVAALPSLPVVQRADMYEAIAVASWTCDAQVAEVALTAAQALRDAEARQLTFAALMRTANSA